MHKASQPISIPYTYIFLLPPLIAFAIIRTLGWSTAMNDWKVDSGITIAELLAAEEAESDRMFYEWLASLQGSSGECLS